MEHWKKIEGFENYSISDCGRVRNDKKNKILNFGIINGYHKVMIYNGGGYKNFLVHRLVAQAFIPNPNNYPIINHKNEIRSDNCVENLEWCTHEYNNNYGTIIERNTLSQPKRKPTIVDGKYFISVNAASKYIGCRQNQLSDKLNRNAGTFRGHTISYAQ